MTDRLIDLAELVPWLDVRSAVRMDGGWTSETYELAGGWIVQVARTRYAADTLRHQLRVLPKLARHLGARIPEPRLACDDPVAVVYRKLEGAAGEAAMPGAWPEQLGGVLSRLHATPPESVGLQAIDAATLRERRRIEWTRLLSLIAPHLTGTERSRAELLLAGLLDDDRNWRFEPVVTHGDLGPEHVLVSPAGELAGVIDWESAGTGDPAVDFAWCLHAVPEIGERMLRAYGGPPDERFHHRARVVYTIMPWHEIAHGIAIGDAASIASGLDGMRARL